MMIKMFYLMVAGIIMVALSSFLASLMIAGGVAVFVGVMGMLIIGMHGSL